MLGTLRENKNSTIISFVVGLIVLAFVMWGPGISRQARGTNIARVNGTPISTIKFRRAVGERVEQFRRFSSQQIPDQQLELVQQQILDQMITQELLRQEADRLGIVVSDAELKKAIVNTSYLKDENGKFDVKRWNRVKRRNPTFEYDTRVALQIAKIQELLRSAIMVSESDLREAFAEKNTKVNLEYVKLPYATFQRKIEISSEDREAFVAEHEEDIRTKYDEDFERLYNLPKKVKASHILLKLGDDDPALADKLRERLSEIRDRAISGEDFAELAKQFSEDPGTTARGGSLGFFEESRMDPEFSKTAFSTPVGEISDVVKSKFGLHIIKVEEVQEARVKSLEEARDSIADTLIREERGPDLARQTAEEVRKVWVEGGQPLEDVLDRYSLEMKETGFTARTSGYIRGIGQSEELAEVAFSLDKGAAHDGIFTVGQSEVLIKLKERQEADDDKFESEKDQLAVEALRKKQSSIFESWLDSLKATSEIDVDTRYSFAATYDAT